MNFEFINIKLTVIWILGFFVRYCILLPGRMCILLVGVSITKSDDDWKYYICSLTNFFESKKKSFNMMMLCLDYLFDGHISRFGFDSRFFE